MRRLSVIMLLALAMTACRQVPVIDTADKAADNLNVDGATANRYLVQGEETQIREYIARRDWQVQRVMGGTYVYLTSGGDGRKLGIEDTVAVEYSLETIDGQTIYSHVYDTVIVGRLQPTRGLDEAMRILCHGSEAVVIVPSGQAYGVVGDGDRVSTRMILVYKLKVK